MAMDQYIYNHIIQLAYGQHLSHSSEYGYGYVLLAFRRIETCAIVQLAGTMDVEISCDRLS